MILQQQTTYLSVNKGEVPYFKSKLSLPQYHRSTISSNVKYFTLPNATSTRIQIVNLQGSAVLRIWCDRRVSQLGYYLTLTNATRIY